MTSSHDISHVSHDKKVRSLQSACLSKSAIVGGTATQSYHFSFAKSVNEEKKETRKEKSTSRVQKDEKDIHRRKAALLLPAQPYPS
jgi:transposase